VDRKKDEAGMIWRLIITHSPNAWQSQETKEIVEVVAPTAADAITICNVRHKLPRRGASDEDHSEITDIYPQPDAYRS
jgi:hypothetical protein